MTLQGRGILVTRPREQTQGLAKLIEAAGGRAILFPAIEIQAAPLPKLAEFDLAIFVSPTAVKQALAAMKWPQRAKAAAVGRGFAGLGGDEMAAARESRSSWPRHAARAGATRHQGDHRAGVGCGQRGAPRRAGAAARHRPAHRDPARRRRAVASRRYARGARRTGGVRRVLPPVAAADR